MTEVTWQLGCKETQIQQRDRSVVNIVNIALVGGLICCLTTSGEIVSNLVLTPELTVKCKYCIGECSATYLFRNSIRLAYRLDEIILIIFSKLDSFLLTSLLTTLTMVYDMFIPPLSWQFINYISIQILYSLFELKCWYLLPINA